MALLGASKASERYIFVETESVDNQVETTSHPTETGIPLSDTVQRNPISISLSGKIVDVDKITAKATIARIKLWQSTGETLTYTGQAGVFQSMQIQSFVTDFNNKNFGGADFEMTLKEVRIAKKAYVKPKTTASTEKTVKSTSNEIKKGDKVIFVGGKVYVDSLTPRAAGTRGRSECKVTDIAKGAPHEYHLLSDDCVYGSPNYVFGWVDAKNVKVEGEFAREYSNGGTQQTQSPSESFIYHKVRSGDTIWDLVNTNYKHLNLSVDEIIAANPQAFSTKGKASTLQIGAKLKLYKN